MRAMLVEIILELDQLVFEIYGCPKQCADQIVKIALLSISDSKESFTNNSA